MYYDTDQVELALKCSFCKMKFREVVKLVPECGCFICDKCHSDAKEEAAETGSYKCESCQETHSMPQNGLPDCKQLLPLLQSQMLEKPLSENARKLKAMVKEVVDEMEKLEAFDGKEFVNTHCDRLEQELKETVASAVEHLSEIESNLLKEINEYRNQCLSKADNFNSKTSQELETLATEIKEFNAKWNRYFTRLDSYECEADIDASLGQIPHFRTKISTLEKRLRDKAFGGQLLVFKPDLNFFQRPDILGKIDSLSIRETRILDTPTTTLYSYQDSGTILALLHLPQNRLASGLEENTIKIWNIEEGEELFKLAGHTDSVYPLALLPNGMLVSGSRDSTIKIWDLDERKEIRTLLGHTKEILSFCILKNGNLASCSSDDTIRVWNPYLSENSLLQTITGHGNIGWLISIEVLSNDSLVSCSRENDEKKETILRVWNVDEGRLIKEVATGLKAAVSLLLLRGDRVVIGYQRGSIRMVDLTNNADSVTKEKAHDSFIFALAQLSHGNLISYGKDETMPTIKVWTLPDFGLLQTVIASSSMMCTPFSIAPDETHLACVAEENLIQIWTITN